MPAIANITVLKDNGATNITFTAVTPSSGDGVPAIWQSQTVGVAISHRPELHLSGRTVEQGRKRKLRSTFIYPSIATNSTTTVTSIVERAMASTDWSIPKNMIAADINEFVTQYANLLTSTLLRDCVKSGYSAT